MAKRLLGSLLALIVCAGVASASDFSSGSNEPGIVPWYIEHILPYQTWCGYPQTFWLSAEFQAVVMKDGHLPPLVTGGPAGTQGILGQPGTVLLYGDEKANHNPFLGGKFMGGVWADYNELYGLEGGFAYASERSDDFVAYTPGSAGAPIICAARHQRSDRPRQQQPRAHSGFEVGTISVENTCSFLARKDI